MCVIIVKKHKGVINQDIALKALCYNQDGFGIQMLDDGKVYRTMDIREAQNWLQSERPYVFHARLTTRGTTSLENTHPVAINEYNNLFHNGTVMVPHNWPKSKSDTQYVADTLCKLPWQSWANVLKMTDSRFAYVRRSKTGKYYVNRVGNWLSTKDGTFYSKANVLDNRNIVAVYGTLRQGHNNHSLLAHGEFLGSGLTVNKYRMTCEGIPFVHPDISEDGNNIVVELYAVDDKIFANLDRLEGHPDWYKREKTAILMDNGLKATAWLYFNPKEIKPTDVFYADFNDYRNPQYPMWPTNVPVGHTEWLYDTDDEDGFSRADFMYDATSNEYFNMLTNEYWSAEEYEAYFDYGVAANQLKMFD